MCHVHVLCCDAGCDVIVCRLQELDQKKRELNDTQIENEYLKLQITQRDKLIQVS